MICVLEFYAGLGGLQAACSTAATVVQAVDINSHARNVYAANFATPYTIKEIETLTASWITGTGANTWWLSPPCQPFTRRGAQADLNDSRTRSLLHLVHRIPECLPQHIFLENVLGFQSSATCEVLLKTLNDHHYRYQWFQVCPSELGWPNRRPRIYLVATQDCPSGLPGSLTPRENIYSKCVADLLEDEANERQELFLADYELNFLSGMDRIEDPKDRNSCTACFGSSYGKSYLHAGSVLRVGNRYRRFSPREVARLMGFPDSYQLLPSLSNRQLWKLLGNSLSLPAVQWVLRHSFS
ncbi:MAG: DNA cytosine methyltransferase [Planctomycetales bacterium]|nr:DNA cytosine methyltransferase [Planctomycetales bacterium]